MAISSPLLDTSINGAKGVLINITGPLDLGLDEVESAAGMVEQAAHPESNIIYGQVFDDTMEDEIRVTIIATGFDEASASSQTQQAAPAAREPVKESPKPAPPKAEEPHAAPKPEEKPAPVPDDDWDILERIFSKKK